MRERNSIIITIGVGLTLLFFPVASYFDAPSGCRVHFYDVGQGDAALIETSRTTQVLIDGGPGKSVLEKLGRDMPLYDRTIELVVLTHPHHDHMGGLFDVLSRYHVEHLLVSDFRSFGDEYRMFMEVAEKNHVSHIEGHAGDVFSLQPLTLSVLAGGGGNVTTGTPSLNNQSIVLRGECDGASYLFAGDTEKDAEEALAADPFASSRLSADVLKAGHHGSKTSSSEPFLALVKPQYAILSLGRGNPFGHPHAETLARLSRIKAQIFRTDTDGDITCIHPATVGQAHGQSVVCAPDHQ